MVGESNTYQLLTFCSSQISRNLGYKLFIKIYPSGTHIGFLFLIKTITVMKNLSTTFAALFLLVLSSYGQNDEPGVQKSLVSLYIIPLKVSYEAGLGKSNTLQFSAGITGATKIENDQFKYSLVPIVEGSYKYYYNLNKRHLKGKNTDLNSGNFWGVNARYSFKSISQNGDDFGSVFISPMWGIQRNYKSRFSLGLRLGYGVVITQENSFLNPFINIKLGFVLFAKQ